MEQRNVKDLAAKFQALLRNFEQDENLRVIRIQDEPGTNVGDNYMSVVIRMIIEGIRGNGTPYNKSFMIKVFSSHPKINEMCRSRDCFNNEALLYEKLLPLLGPFGPKCVLATPQEVILEDLRQRQFAVISRLKMLDFDHCKAVMQMLGSFHATSLALHLKDPEHFKELTKPLADVAFPCDSRPAVGQCINAGVELAINCIEFDPEMTKKEEKLIAFLASYKKDAYSKMQRLMRRYNQKNKYKILIHGDTWNNNILFSHGPDGKIVNVKFIDYQMSKIYSPAMDLCYFLFTSPTTDIVDNNLDDLLKIYHDYFIHELRKLDVREQDIYALSLSWLREEMKNFGIPGFLFALVTAQSMMMGENQQLPVEMDSDFSKDHSWINRVPLTLEKSKRIRIMVEKYMTFLL